MKKLFAIPILFALLALPAMAQAAPKALATWDKVTTYTDGTAIPATTVITYHLYRGLLATGTDQVKLNSAPIATNSYTDTTLSANTIYWYSVTSADANGLNESAKSTFVSFNFRLLGIPANLKINPTP